MMLLGEMVHDFWVAFRESPKGMLALSKGIWRGVANSPVFRQRNRH